MLDQAGHRTRNVVPVPHRGSSHSSRTIGRLRQDLADQRQALSDNIADLRLQRVELVTASARLKRTCVEIPGGHPPLSLLLDHMPNLVFRRAYREHRKGRPLRLALLFYGADVGAMFGHADQNRQPSLAEWFRRVHPQDRAAYRAAEVRRHRFARGYTIEYRCEHALSGDYRWMRETAAPPYQTLSGRRMLDSYIIDITEEKCAEEALRASEERFRAIVEDQTEYIRRFDRDRRLTFVNGALCRLLHRSREDLLGLDMLEVMPDVEPETARRRLRALTRARPAVTYEVQVAQPDGSRRWHEWTDRGIFDKAGRIREYQSVGRDITERKRAEQQTRYLAQHDQLTDLPNRALLEDHLRRALAQAGRDHRRAAVLLFDLDGFKRINDTLGHLVGDQLLRGVGERLRGGVRGSDVVARLGGDEFAVVQSALDHPDGASVLARKLIAALGRPFEVSGEPIVLGASGGVALYPDHGDTAAGLIKAADLALYRAKAEGRNTFRLFAPEMEAKVSQRRCLERDVRTALERGEPELVYQPRIDLREQREVALEALIRWRRPGHGIIPTGAFLEVADALGLAQKLDSWMIRQACTHAARWRQAGLRARVAVNLSAGQITEPQLARLLQRTLEQTALRADRLELELTEQAIIAAGNEATIACLRRLTDLGVSLTINGFGSALSSFARLRHLPVHAIKIDSSFIGRIGQNRDDELIIRSMIELSHALGKRVVAEGVETKRQLEFLREQGCDEAQGFLLAPPVEATEVLCWLAPSAVVAQPGPGITRRSPRRLDALAAVELSECF